MMLLLACTAGPGDTDKIGDTDTAPTDDSGDDSGTPPVVEGYEICADGADNDGDGAADEPDCAEATMTGDSASWLLGGQLVAAVGDPSLVLVKRTFEETSQVCRLSASEGALSLPWCVHGFHPAAAAVGDDTWISVSRPRADTEVNRVVLLSVTATGAVESNTLVSDGGLQPGTGTTDIDTSGALLVPAGSGVVFLVPDPQGVVPSIESAATLRIEGDLDYGFGYSACFLPDPGGDGISEIVVGMRGSYPYEDRSGIYIFDGAATGTVTPEEADASVIEDIEGYADKVQRAGDVDGDGYEDLIVSIADDDRMIWGTDRSS